MNDDYKATLNAWGQKATPIIVQAAKLVKSHHPSAIDLGAGQGRDSLYLASRGFRVTALDKSEVGLGQIKVVNDQIETVVTDIAQYSFDRKYDLVVSINMLHFLSREEILDVIKDVREFVKPNGLVAISVLLDNGQIRPRELKNWFKNFEIILYEEFTKHDQPHIGTSYPHTHQISQIIARKQ
jgi:tellurite methyltransferase